MARPVLYAKKQAGTELAIKDYIDKTVYIEKDFNKVFKDLLYRDNKERW